MTKPKDSSLHPTDAELCARLDEEVRMWHTDGAPVPIAQLLWDASRRIEALASALAAVQRIAAEACRLQREADWHSPWGWRDSVRPVRRVDESPLVVQPPEDGK